MTAHRPCDLTVSVTTYEGVGYDPHPANQTQRNRNASTALEHNSVISGDSFSESNGTHLMRRPVSVRPAVIIALRSVNKLCEAMDLFPNNSW